MGGGMVRRLSPASAGRARGHHVTSAPLAHLLPAEVGHCRSSRDSVPPAPHSPQEAQVGCLPTPPPQRARWGAGARRLKDQSSPGLRRWAAPTQRLPVVWDSEVDFPWEREDAGPWGLTRLGRRGQQWVQQWAKSPRALGRLSGGGKKRRRASSSGSLGTRIPLLAVEARPLLSLGEGARRELAAAQRGSAESFHPVKPVGHAARVLWAPTLGRGGSEDGGTRSRVSRLWAKRGSRSGQAGPGEGLLGSQLQDRARLALYLGSWGHATLGTSCPLWSKAEITGRG